MRRRKGLPERSCGGKGDGAGGPEQLLCLSYQDAMIEWKRKSQGGRSMELGFWMCIVLVFGFAAIGLLFGILKEKAAVLVSGFNSIPEKERDSYDKAGIARDVRNSCFLWAAVMLAGAAGSLFWSGYFAVAAYLVWIVLFFRDVHLDARKAFEKYRL